MLQFFAPTTPHGPVGLCTTGHALDQNRMNQLLRLKVGQLFGMPAQVAVARPAPTNMA